jgi:hypothetical protein
MAGESQSWLSLVMSGLSLASFLWDWAANPVIAILTCEVIGLLIKIEGHLGATGGIAKGTFGDWVNLT